MKEEKLQLQTIIPSRIRKRLANVPIVDKTWQKLHIIGKPIIHSHFNGVNIDLPYKIGEDYINAVVDGTYEENSWNLLKKNINPLDGIFIDVGANLGWYSLQAANIGFNVIAIEPAKDNLPLLMKNISLNPKLANRIKILPIALSDYVGTAEFHIASTGNGGHSLVKVHKSYDSYNVEVDKLDNRCIEKVAAIKIDVEGNEIRVLNGMKDIIGEYKPVMQIECFSDGLKASGYSAKILLETIHEKNYNVRIVAAKETYKAEFDSIEEICRIAKDRGELAVNLFCKQKENNN